MYHIIVNPASRSGKGRRIWTTQVKPALQRGSIPYQVHFSEKAGDVSKLAREIAQNNQGTQLTLIILGGDGTMNEAIQGISDFSDITFGYIPTGSSNDFARDLGISSNPTDALDCILHSGKVYTLDLGTVTYEDGETRRFAVSCGIGYDAAICEEALHSGIKKVLNQIGLGKLTYVGIALKQLLATGRVSASLLLDKGSRVEMDSMLFTVCMLHRYEGGGFMFCPEADATDGKLDLCAVGDISKYMIIPALPLAQKGKHYKFKGITPYRAGEITISTSSPLWVHTDGEVTRKSSKISISCQKGCLRMIH